MKNIKIAIHHIPNSFTVRWQEYCKYHDIKYNIVNCYDTDIMAKLNGVDLLLWPISQNSQQDLLFSRQIIAAVEINGKAVYPNISTCLHFDDKIAQKYLLEGLDAPMVASHVFYQKEEALNWLKQTTFPKVFKLKGGAGSANVRFVKNKNEAIKLCQQAFSQGFVSYHGYFGDAKTKLRKIGTFQQFIDKLKRFPKYLLSSAIIKQQMPREGGYVYFQDFMPGNQYDTRITVIGNRAFGFTRDVRPNDFRASGSGSISYDLKRIDMECVKISFKVAENIKSQSMAFDFIKDKNGKPKIVELSYGFQTKAIYDCPGYWNKELIWHEGHIWPEDAILEDIITIIYNK